MSDDEKLSRVALWVWAETRQHLVFHHQASGSYRIPTNTRLRAFGKPQPGRGPMRNLVQFAQMVTALGSITIWGYPEERVIRRGPPAINVSGLRHCQRRWFWLSVASNTPGLSAATTVCAGSIALGWRTVSAADFGDSGFAMLLPWIWRLLRRLII